MNKIIMIDLEGVLIDTADDPKPLPYAEEFLIACLKLFDDVYLNTAVPETRAKEILDKTFGISSIKYWRWRHFKTEGYRELIRNNFIVHVEDGVFYTELVEMKRLGVYYINLNPERERELERATELIVKYIKERKEELEKATELIIKHIKKEDNISN